VRQNGRQKHGSEYAEKLLRITGNSQTVDDAIQLLVGEVLQDISVAPTDLDALQQRLRIVECRPEDIPFSGELRRKGKERSIIYSMHLSADRRRFTIAHEMGHAVLETAGFPLPHSGIEIERLCDKFAAEILMPKSVFLSRLGDSLTVQRLLDLKRTFKVSLVAIAYRCFNLQRLSAFEVENGTVVWGVGVVKKGPLHLVDPGLRLVIDEAEESEAGNHEMYFVDQGNTYRGEVEWGRQPLGRTLFILRRSRDQKLTVTAPQ
jgi:hypothetical protein